MYHIPTKVAASLASSSTDPKMHPGGGDQTRGVRGVSVVHNQTRFGIKGIWSTKRHPHKLILQWFKDESDVKINLSSLLFWKSGQSLCVCGKKPCKELLRSSVAFSYRLKWLTPSSLLPLKAAFSLSRSLSFLCLSLYSSLSVLPSQRLAGFSARGALGCKALHVEGEGETNKSALVLQKQAHRCMPVKRSVRLLWLP